MKRLITLFILLYGCPLLAEGPKGDPNIPDGDRAETIVAKKTAEPMSSGPTTTYGYDRFCSNPDNVKNIIDSLNKTTSTEIEKIKKSAERINAIEAKKKMLSDFFKARDEFKFSFDKILKEKKISDNLDNSIENFKKLLNSSLVLSSVNLMVKSSTNKQDILAICSEPANKGTQICNNLSVLVEMFRTPSSRTEIDTINKILKNAQITLSHVTPDEKKQIEETLKLIYDSTIKESEDSKKVDVLPKGSSAFSAVASPEKVLNDLTTLAPDLTSALAKSQEKDEIIKCLQNEKKFCESLLNQPQQNRPSFKELITSGMNKFQKAMIEKELDRNFNNFADNSKKFDIERKGHINRATNQFLDAFRKDPNSNAKMFTAEELARIEENCTAKTDEAIDLDACTKTSSKIITSLEEKVRSLDEMEKNENDKLKDLTNNVSGPLAINEKMKKYIVEKYMRKCKNNDKNFQSNFTCAYLQDSLKGSIADLGSHMSSIVGMMQDNIASNKQGENDAFSKPELEVYLNYCQNTTANENYKVICEDVSASYNRIAHLREAKEWKEFHKKYWVEYDSKSKKGYEVYEKKSNWRILGEGLSQSVNSIYPIWFSNMQMNYQIDMMTNQALYQKQMLYMYSPNSPWMSYPYFQGNFYPTNGTGFNFTN